MCTGAGVWSGWGPTVHHCARVSLGVRTRHNCSHCISAASCVIINCPHNNWRFVILARISHSLSLQLSDLTSERRCNNHSSVGWKEKYSLKSRVFNSFTRISGEHEALLWKDNKEQGRTPILVFHELCYQRHPSKIWRICSPSQTSRV